MGFFDFFVGILEKDTPFKDGVADATKGLKKDIAYLDPNLFKGLDADFDKGIRVDKSDITSEHMKIYRDMLKAQGYVSVRHC